MNASDLYQAGRLRDALHAQLQAVKGDPVDPAKRIFLFELLLFTGDIDRARKHLEAADYNDIKMDSAKQEYRRLLDAEQARRLLFQTSREPGFLAEPPEHVRWRIEALTHLRENRLEAAAQLITRANEAIPQMTGTLNKKPFSGLRDADDVFGSVLEVMAQGRYFWVPLEQVAGLAMNPPKYPRDLFFFPARLSLRDGQEGEVYLPALYPFSHQASEEALQLGRATDWKTPEIGPVQGLGARTFLIGEDLSALADWRELLVD